MTSTTIHLIGCKLVDGQRVRFFGQVPDREFNEKCVPLAAGWFAWHIDIEELKGDGSARVQAIKEVPVLESPSIEMAVKAITVGEPADKFWKRMGTYHAPVIMAETVKAK